MLAMAFDHQSRDLERSFGGHAWADSNYKELIIEPGLRWNYSILGCSKCMEKIR